MKSQQFLIYNQYSLTVTQIGYYNTSDQAVRNQWEFRLNLKLTIYYDKVHCKPIEDSVNHIL